MNRKHLLLGTIAAVFAVAGCQPTTQDGGTGATPMPPDTMMTDTTTGDTLTSAAPEGATREASAYLAARV